MLHLINVTRQHGDQILFNDASLQVLPGDRAGLVGPNGAGKSTIFRLITGDELPDTGSISCARKTIIGHFSQDVGDMSGRTALAEVMAAAGDTVRLGQELRQMEATMSEPMEEEALTTLLERYGEAMEDFEHKGGYDLESRAQAILTGLGIGPEDYLRPVESFSGGWKMRIALASILTINPDVLLLDEPTNHLDLESIVWLENWLTTEFKGSVLMTSHDRDFMNRIVSRIIEVANGSVTTYSGNYDFYLREREVRREQLRASYQRQQAMLAKEEDFIARFAARVSHAAQVQSRIKKLEKIDRIELPVEQRLIHFEFPDTHRSGEDVVRCEGLAKTWQLTDGSEKTVFSGVSGVIRRQEKIAVVGVNGAGKSTFLKLLARQVEPSSGSVRIGASVTDGYFSQHALDLLHPDLTILETMQIAIPEATIGMIHNICGAFLFSGDDVEKRISILSGGEKSRVVLATLLAKPLNFLILDEPTNHLDIQSREVLLTALQKYSGTVVLVSHDRHFLRSLPNRVFELDHGEIRIYEGNYEYYQSKSTAAQQE